MHGIHLVLGTDTIEEIARRAHALLDGKEFSIATCDVSTYLYKDQRLDLGTTGYAEENGGRDVGGITVYPDQAHIIFNTSYGVFSVSPSNKAKFYFADNLMVISLVASAGTICNWTFLVEDLI
jgi:hypothetical protein